MKKPRILSDYWYRQGVKCGLRLMTPVGLSMAFVCTAMWKLYLPGWNWTLTLLWLVIPVSWLFVWVCELIGEQP